MKILEQQQEVVEGILELLSERHYTAEEAKRVLDHAKFEVERNAVVKTEKTPEEKQRQEEKASIICLLNHLEALRLQTLNRERADFGKPCESCKLWDSCKGHWYDKIGDAQILTGCFTDWGHRVRREKLDTDAIRQDVDSR